MSIDEQLDEALERAKEDTRDLARTRREQTEQLKTLQEQVNILTDYVTAQKLKQAQAKLRVSGAPVISVDGKTGNSKRLCIEDTDGDILGFHKGTTIHAYVTIQLKDSRFSQVNLTREQLILIRDWANAVSRE